jgi:hypothetical protein
MAADSEAQVAHKVGVESPQAHPVASYNWRQAENSDGLYIIALYLLQMSRLCLRQNRQLAHVDSVLNQQKCSRIRHGIHLIFHNKPVSAITLVRVIKGDKPSLFSTLAHNFLITSPAIAIFFSIDKSDTVTHFSKRP